MPPRVLSITYSPANFQLLSHHSHTVAFVLAAFGLISLLSGCVTALPNPNGDSASGANLVIKPIQPSSSTTNAIDAAGGLVSIKSAVVPTSVATIPIAPEGEYITDALYDATTNQIYVTDSYGQLTVLDGTTYTPLIELTAFGFLTLDAHNRRLYVTPDEFPLPPGEQAGQPALITVLQLGQSSAELPRIVETIPGTSLSIDPIRHRLYVGEPLQPGQSAVALSNDDQLGVRIIDGETLMLIGQSTHSGRPVYNSIADNLLIVAYNVYTADAQTGEVTGALDLLPPDEEPFFWCNGCTWATAAYILPDQTKVGVLASPHFINRHASHPLRAFDAATLEPLAEPILHTERGPDCGNPLTLRLPPEVGEQLLYHAFDANYITNNSLEIYANGNHFAEGQLAPIRRIAGLSPIEADADSNQLVTADGLLINMASIAPVTVVEPYCVLGLISGHPKLGKAQLARSLSPWEEGESLHIIQWVEERVNQPEPIPSAGLLGYEAAQILPSPTYGQTDTEADRTLFVRTEYENGLFRSEDSGNRWELLDIGLPWDLLEGMSIQLSPNFANDRTLFVAGPNVHHRGLGVWISVDAGDTWHPRWQGLDDLRIASLVVSPRFSLAPQGQNSSTDAQVDSDQALIIQTIEGQIYRSNDAGALWTLLPDAVVEGAIENLTAFLLDDGNVDAHQADAQEASVQPRVRIDFMTGDLVYQAGEHQSATNEEWLAVAIELPPLANGSPQYWSQVIPNPADPFTYYALSDRTLWRTLDGGVNWLEIPLPQLSTMPDVAYIRTAALTGDPYGDTTLIVGTSHGEVWVVE